MTSSAIGDPDADAAILFREGELNDNDPEGTSLRVYVRIKIFTDRGRRYAEVRLPYRADLGKITDIKARTVKPDGSIVQVDDDRDVYDRVVVKTARGVWRVKVFSMPAASSGSIIEYRYRQSYPRGFRYFALDLQSDLFIRTLLYRIQPQATSPLDVRWIPFNVPDPSRFAPTWDGTYNIKAEHIPPFRREPLMPPEQTVKMWGWLHYSNETEKDPERYWKNYARLMFQRASDETKTTPAIRNVIGSITHSSDDLRKKLERIYGYVQTQIQNSGLDPRESQGEVAGQQNANADETIRRRRGTARDINRLFIAMARAVGFDARVAELTTRDETFFNRSFPDSFQLNGEATAVVARDGAVEFYDPGSPYCPMGMLSWEKEVVPALVYGRNDSRFVETPVRSARDNVERRRLVVRPHPDGGVGVQQELNLHGQPALQLRSKLAYVDPKEHGSLFIEQLKTVHPTVMVDDSSMKVLHVFNPAAPLQFNSSFLVPGFALRPGTRLMLRPALLSRLDQSLLTAATRVNKVYFQFPWSEEDDVSIAIPEGYLVEPLPDQTEFDIGAAHYRASFRREANRVIYERRLAVSAIIIGVDEYQTLKNFFDRVHQADQAVISFRR